MMIETKKVLIARPTNMLMPEKTRLPILEVVVSRKGKVKYLVRYQKVLWFVDKKDCILTKE